MSYLEAKEDGIRMARTSGSLMGRYYPRCHICGEEVMSLSYLRGVKYTCDACKLAFYLSNEAEKRDSDYSVKEKKLEKAVGRIREKAKRFSVYEQAIKTIQNNLHEVGWFDSTEEIMVAIELIKNNIATRHQVKFGRYRADFVLPDEKVVLEVDGALFHTKKSIPKENARDNFIVLALGPEWEVIRISDELINENITKLVPAIRKIKRRRATERSAHAGALPKWYSDRDI